MASLLVRGIDDRLVQALKERAARHGRSTEAEHRLILERALYQPERRSLAQILATMPNVGQDTDFERIDDTDAAHVFD